jgi:hypothetical protein
MLSYNRGKRREKERVRERGGVEETGQNKVEVIHFSPTVSTARLVWLTLAQRSQGL